jgi:hypothetical protein
MRSLERLREIYERLGNKNGPEGERTGKTREQRRTRPYGNLTG